MTEVVSDERIEFKYSIKLNEVNKFQQKLFETPYSLIKNFQERKINSFYFDTHNLVLLHQSLAGLSSKEKFRYRFYGDFKNSLSGQWEIKKKQGIVTSKLTYKENVEYDKLISHSKKHNFSKNEQISKYLLKYPRIVKSISYNRRYFVSSVFGSKFRATIDYDLKSSNFLNSQSLRARKNNLAIIELKIDKEIYDNIHIKNFLNLSRLGYSKYLEA